MRQLNAGNYFSRAMNMRYMSVSQYKAFNACEAAALAEIKGRYRREETVSLLVGSYVDAFYEGTLDAFRETHPQIFKRDGELKSDYIQANEIIARTMRDRYFTKLMSGEKQVIMTGKIAGVDVKIKIDSLRPDMIVDLKVIKDFDDLTLDDRGRLPFFEAWRYDMQGAVYQEIVRQNTGKKLPFVLACATKEKVTAIDAVEIEQHSLDFCLDEFAAAIPGFDAIKKGIIKPERCEKCDFCKETRKLKKPTLSGEFYL